MSGPPPPFGHPWMVNVGNNPNINRDPPPPPFEGGPLPIHIQIPVAAPAPAAPAGNVPPPPNGVIVNGLAPGAHIPFVGGPPPGPPPPYAPFGGFGGFGGFPGGGGGMLGGFGMTPQGFPPPPNPGTGVSPLAPGMAGFGFNGMGGMGMGMGMGMGFPGCPPPFAAGGMPWAAGGGMYGGGFNPWQKPPVPIIEGQGGGVGPAAGEQNDPTVLPGGTLPGHTRVEPPETTSVFRILTNALPWEHVGQPLSIEAMQFDSGWTLNRVIQAMRKPNSDCQGWGVTQCIELGGGRWAKGMTYVYGSQQATEMSLSMVGMGPGSNRNGSSEKLYVYVHRI